MITSLLFTLCRPTLPRITLGLLLLGGLLLGGSVWLRSSSRPATQIPPQDVNEALFAALRAGDLVAVRQALHEGADPNAHNPMGDTPLMQATLHANLEIMQLLLQHGSAVNGRGVYGAPALLRALHDPAKVARLLQWGAVLEQRTMVLAAMVPGSRETLEQLWRRGGNVNIEVGGYTPLMAASYAGDLEAAAWLIEHGANVKARSEAGCTALNGAAVAGNAALVKLLLEHGADPNVHYEEPNTIGDFQTPSLNAAWHGNAACLKLLLEHGAEVNVHGGLFERTPLLCAATTGSAETIQLLLDKGADSRATDWHGERPLDWALRRGDTAIVALLRKAGAPAAVAEHTPPSRQRADARTQATQEQAIRTALAAGLPLLQRSGQQITQTKKCVTCHQHALVAMTVGLARRHGLPVDENIAASEREQVTTILNHKVPLLLLGADLDPTLAAYTLAGFAAEEQEPSLLSDALVHYLVLHQQYDGHWQPEAYRPPDDSSPFLFTALALRGLQVYTPPGRRRELAERMARAGSWLRQATPAETVDSVFQVLGLAWSGASPAELQRVAGPLLQLQRLDGGWAQLPTLPSDAYATGQALYALHESGSLATEDSAYQRGVQFLLATQCADGSWYVPTRCFPVLPYSSSGFPHGRSQFISASGTCWATMALIVTVKAL
jgi:ankyrin repeat protein